MRELTVMARLLPLLLCGWLGATAPAAEAQRLKSLRVYAGFLGEKPGSLPLQLPALSLSPEYHRDTTSYTAGVAQSDLTVRCRAARRAGITLSGRSSAGAKLSVGNRTYLKDVSAGENEGTFLSATLSGLSSGENVIEIVVTAEDETTRSYRLVARHAGSQ